MDPAQTSNQGRIGLEGRGGTKVPGNMLSRHTFRYVFVGGMFAAGNVLLPWSYSTCPGCSSVALLGIFETRGFENCNEHHVSVGGHWYQTWMAWLSTSIGIAWYASSHGMLGSAGEKMIAASRGGSKPPTVPGKEQVDEAPSASRATTPSGQAHTGTAQGHAEGLKPK